MANPTPDDMKASSTRPTSSGAAGAATSKAPETPLREGGVGRRRSDRVVIAIPIEFSGTDWHGTAFIESCYTEIVSLHGASVALSRRLSMEHPVTLRRRTLKLEARAHVAGQLGMRLGFHVYGLTFIDPADEFWGIRFPALGGSDLSMARTLLKCSECGRRNIFTFNEIEFRVFDANQSLSHECETCARAVTWIPVVHEADPAKPKSEASHKRQHPRTRMKVVACIQGSGAGDDVVEVLDISSDGACFRGARAYEVNSRIDFAVPYLPGAVNIFVAGRIAWKKDLGGGQHEYGVQYIRG